MQMTVQQLASELGGDVRGNGQAIISNVESLEQAGPGDVTFLSGEPKLSTLARIKAGAMIVDRKTAQRIPESADVPTLVIVDDAKAAFVTILPKFRTIRERALVGISPAAHIAKSAQIGQNCNIHAGATIAEGVVLGDGCDVLPGAYIGPGCRLGDSVTIHPNVVIYQDVVIGNRVIIHASAVIGADGFGYQFQGGRFLRIPHVGTVHIHDDVEIGACATIDRGMVGPTVIGEGTKIDNLVMIGHNCIVGKHNAFASQVGLAGSVRTGDYVRCAGQVGIADHLHLGDGSTLGAKAAVHKNVPAGETHYGYPAGKDTEQARILIMQSRLPEMRKQLKDLENQMREMTQRLASLENEETVKAA